MNLAAINQVIEEYLDQVLPAMYRQKYNLLLAKGGPDYPHLSEQSFLGHIINGVFGLISLLKFTVGQGILIRGLDEVTLRKALALYSVHDLHKFNDFETIGRSEFAIPLERLREEYKKLCLHEFAGEIDEHLMRAANVSKRSKHHGDLLLSDEDGALLWLLVRIADTIASASSPSEAAGSLGNYVKQLAPELGTEWRLYTHELRDVRGVLTNLIHNVIHTRLAEEHGLYPLLYFSTGTLYVGPKKIIELDRKKFIDALVDGVLSGMIPQPEMVKSSAVDGLRREKYDFQPYVFTFASIETLLEIVLEETQRAKPDAKEVEKDIGQIAAKKNAPPQWAKHFKRRFAASVSESKDFCERWFLVRRYLLYLETLLKSLAPNLNRLTWYADTFDVPARAIPRLFQYESLFASGGIGKHILVPAYHFLRGPDFADRSAEARDATEVLQMLHKRTVAFLGAVDMQSGREAVIADLGLRTDLADYLGEKLTLSFAPETYLSDDALANYVAQKKKGHTHRVCSICNRGGKYVKELRTGILGDSGREFSNRVLPAKVVSNELRSWCPICHLEFILRKLAGLALPSNANYGQSYRIFIYVLPTFSFSSEHARLLKRMLRPLQQVTAMPIRDYGQQSPGLPRLWLERSQLDAEWTETVISVFQREAEKIAQWSGYVGDRLMTARMMPQPNYYLIPWERSVRDKERDDARIPTHTEAWAKVIFTAAVIASLTNSRVFVTERPYLPLSNPGESKATITLDSPPPVIARLLGNEQEPKLAGRADTISLYGTEVGTKSGLERAVDLCASLWIVTSELHRPDSHTKDKQIAERLSTTIVEPMAGAHFYKEYGRLNDDASPFPILVKACEVLLQYFGGELMDLVTEVTERSLEIRLPFREFGRGKAHNYELVFREAVDAMRAAFRLLPELRQAALSGKKPSVDTIAELKTQAAGTLLKAMERRRITRRGDGVINPLDKNLGQLVGEFLDLIVDNIFLGRADGSFAQFLRLENSLADGVYYYTDRTIEKKLEQWKAYKEAKKAKAESQTTA
jgi:hypothetical protein